MSDHPYDSGPRQRPDHESMPTAKGLLYIWNPDRNFRRASSVEADQSTEPLGHHISSCLIRGERE